MQLPRPPRQELCRGQESFVRQSQVGPGAEGLGLGSRKRVPVPTRLLPTQSELQQIRLSFERKKMAITEVPAWLVGGGSPGCILECNAGPHSLPPPRCGTVWLRYTWL